MKIHKIDFFKNSVSQYDVLPVFMEGLQKALKRLGVRTKTFDLDQESQSEILAALTKDPPDATAGFNVVMEQHTLFEPLGIPHISLIVDCMTYYPSILYSDNTIPCYVEQDSCGFFKFITKREAILLLHAVDRDLLSPKNLEQCRKQKRDLDLVMCGSYLGSEEIVSRWKERLSAKAVEALLRMAEDALTSTHRTHMQCFAEEIGLHGFFEKELMTKQISFYDTMNSLELYIRSIDRTRFLQAIEGVDLHIFGPKESEVQWKRVLKNKKRVFYHDGVPFKMLPEIFRRSRAILNSLPTIKRGLHERLLLAFTQGASVLGNENIYIDSQFLQSKALLNILPPDYNRASSLLEFAFQDESARLEDVFATHSIIREHHTWDARAETLVKKLPQFITEISDKNKHGVIPLFDKKSQI